MVKVHTGAEFKTGEEGLKYSFTVECRNEEEVQEVLQKLKRPLCSCSGGAGSAKDLAVDAGAKDAGYTPSCERTRLALDALQKCQRIKLADAGTKLEAWARAFPNVDMAYWITKQDAWAVSSDTKWSTKGWARHLNWRLSKSQDEARGSGAPVFSNNEQHLRNVQTDPAVDAWAKAAE